MNLTIEEVKQRLASMKSHFASGFSCTEQEFLEELNYLFFKKGITQTGCQDCYRDAYIILSNKIKTMTELPQRSDYILKAGIVKHRFGSADYYTLDLPIDFAEAWLHDYPEDISDFQAYPEDWQDRVTARFAPESTIYKEDDTLPTNSIESARTQKRSRRKANY